MAEYAVEIVETRTRRGTYYVEAPDWEAAEELTRQAFVFGDASNVLEEDPESPVLTFEVDT